MRLPAFDRAHIAPSKITDYLLALDHPTGQYKAVWLLSLGFTLKAPHTVATAIKRHAVMHEVAEEIRTAFGTRYVVDGIMPTPNGRNPRVRCVWFIETGSAIPQ